MVDTSRDRYPTSADKHIFGVHISKILHSLSFLIEYDWEVRLC